MNNTTLATREPDALAFIEQPSPEALQAALAEGQLQKLSTPQRLQFLAAVCRSMGLSPLSRPFEFLNLQGKIVLYARKDATDQLRKLHNVSLKVISREQVGDVLIVTTRATLPNGREDESIGAVPFGNLRGEAAAIAAMKAETKSKRRVTLSICGLGFMDESEIEDAQAAQHPQPGERATMPATAEVVVKVTDEQPPKAHEAPPKAASPIIEAETTPAEPPLEDPEFELMRDFLDIVAQIADPEKLTKTVGDAEQFKNAAHVQTVKRAINARSKELGLVWSAKEKAFVPKPAPIVA